MKKTLFTAITILLNVLNTFAIDFQPLQKNIHKALGDASYLEASVMTNIPLNSAGYMGVLNTADGIQEGGLVRNATYFNADIAKRFVGRNVNAITTAIYWQGVAEAKIWIRHSLDGPDLWSLTCKADEFGRIVDPDANEVIYDETGNATVIDYESPIDIPCNYVLDGKPIYVGHDLQLRPEYSGIHAYVCAPVYTEGHWFFCPDAEAGWQDFSGNGAYIFELKTTATESSAAGLANDDASITNISSIRAKCGETTTAEIFVGNYGRNNIRSINFQYEISGEIGNFSLDTEGKIIPYGAVIPVSFDFTMPTEAMLHDIRVSIVKVNGNDDTFVDGNSYTGSAMALNPESEHRRVAVMENFASLYQSDEPYAIRSIEELQKKYGEQFLLIDAHYGQSGMPENWWTYDPWHCQDYAAQREAMFKIPNCIVNRIFTGDPYYGSEADFLAGKNGIVTVIDDIVEQTAEAIVDGSAAISEDILSIDTKASITFLSNVEDISHYTIGYVVTEDGLVGKQRNIYAGNYECFKWFQELGLPDLPFWWERIFNDVAREASLRHGVPGLLRGSASSGNAVTCQFAVPMPKYYDNPANLHVVILLMETSTGEIVAAKKVSVDATNGISDIKSNTYGNENIYNISGQRVDSTAKGLLIKNGKKIFIK